MRYWKEVNLKDGQKCILCNAEKKDAAAVLQHLIQVSGESDMLSRYPDEVKVTVEQERMYLERLKYDDRAVLICAYIEGRLAGNVGVNPINLLERYQHRAEIGISVKKEFWSKGVGFRLMEAAIEAAECMDYEQVELEVITDNQKAVKLYLQMGFKVYGTRENSFHYRDGSSKAAYLMYRNCDMVLPLNQTESITAL